jgi:hypothetical protein
MSGLKAESRPARAEHLAGSSNETGSGPIQQQSTATPPGSNRHELPPTPCVSWDSRQTPSSAASSGRRGRARCVARLAGQHRELTVTPGQPDTPAHLHTGRLTRCTNRPSKQPVTHSTARRCTACVSQLCPGWLSGRLTGAAIRPADDTPPLAPCAWLRLLLPRSAAGWS